ncbi:rod-binding protein [Clostridiaceae bacterium M8S5]|nr:rod-binding protein [Clostridiaceae bacterium M8S5]
MDNLNINSSTYTNTVYKKSEAKALTKEQKLLKACRDFEAMFINIMFKEMNKTVGDSGLTEKSSGRKMFEEMHTEKLAENMAHKGQGVGLAKVLYNSMKRNIY